LGKPAAPEDAYSSGYVDCKTLNQWLHKVETDPSNPGWKPNLMFWHFLSDLNGTSLATATASL
jgi:hypothetical protein